uniref:Uncharacterized protein n=1 Tax=Oryza nivara TaxID=4536 RepID=A0A0E0IK34_ORYNI
MVWMMLIHGPKPKLALTENGWPSPTATRCQNPNIGTGIRGTCRGSRVQTPEAAALFGLLCVLAIAVVEGRKKSRREE